MTMQPSNGSDLWTVEARGADGMLRFDCPQPPPSMACISLDGLYRAFFQEVPEGPEGVGTWDNLQAWLARKSWTARRCTWR